MRSAKSGIRIQVSVLILLLSGYQLAYAQFQKKKVRIPSTLINRTKGSTHSPGNLKRMVD